jgi:uncharacterized cofD-like protein
MQKVLKWFRPGLRIKRWIAVIFLGLLFAVLASAALIAFFNYTTMPGGDPGGKFVVAAILGYMLAALCLITGIYRLMKSMWGLVEHRGPQRGLVEAAYQRAVLTRGPRVVAIGGGTGLSVVLSGLREVAGYTTAIVSMADDGGSSGKLRKELGLQPPGDLRKCLIALADEEPLMAELLDYRFPEHELEGHNFGNLFLTVLARIRGDFGAGVREANRILSVRGQVLPSTLDRIHLVATHEDGSKTTGQAEIAKSEKRIKQLDVKPRPEPAAPDILKAIAEAELIVLGPGSLYTSVLPNLLIEGLASELAKSKAKKVFVANIMTYEGETKGFELTDFLKAVDEHTYPFRVYDYVLVNNGVFQRPGGESPVAPGTDENTWVVADRPVRLVRYDLSAYRQAAFRVVAQDVVNPAYPIRHDSRKLARALMEILKES